jgi:hypothetical protein
MKRILFVGAAMAALLSPFVGCGVSWAGDTALFKRWYALEDTCRDDPLGQEKRACHAREVVSKQLEALGYCYTGIFGADTHWEYTGSRAVCAKVQRDNEAEAVRQVDAIHPLTGD